MTEKVLILGGSGYLGSEIYRIFNKHRGYRVWIGDVINSDLNAENLYSDILKKDDLNQAIKEQNIIINCTGQVSNPMSKCLRLNTEGIENIAYAVLNNNCRLIHLSTVSVYGTIERGEENSECNPESPYAAAKSFAEYILKSKLPENNFVILRVPNLYGGNPGKGIFAYLRKSYLTDGILQFDNDGTLLRYFLHLEDCAEQIFETVENKLKGVYNLIYSDRYYLKDLVNQIEITTGKKYKAEYLNTKPKENIMALSFDKICKEIEYRPKKHIEEYILNNFPG